MKTVSHFSPIEVHFIPLSLSEAGCLSYHKIRENVLLQCDLYSVGKIKFVVDNAHPSYKSFVEEEHERGGGKPFIGSPSPFKLFLQGLPAGGQFRGLQSYFF